MNPDLNLLQPYPFEKLRQLLDGVVPNPNLRPLRLSVGEPQHPTPNFILQALRDAESGIGKYPLTKGDAPLRTAISQWLNRRFNLGEPGICPESQVLPVCGTREALFSFTQAAADRQRGGLAVMCNPCYQIYEGAALLGGLQPHYLNARDENGQPMLESVGEEVWKRCQILYLCTPDNPTGAVLRSETLKLALDLAERFDFIIASDECYSEIYLDESAPPTGLLEVAKQLGNDEFHRCVVFHSLSKRSNAPGLRSGFVAGDTKILAEYLRYRTYHGAAMSGTVQTASAAAWADEAHVEENRRQYRAKFTAAAPILAPHLEFAEPKASFYLWASTPGCDQAFVKELYREQNVHLVPGSFMSRCVGEADPGRNRIRISLVPSLDDTIEAANRIAEFADKH